MILKEDFHKIAKDFSRPHTLQTVFPCCSVLGTAVIPVRTIAAAWEELYFVQSYNTNPYFCISFSTTKAKSILLQFKTLPGGPCPHRTLPGHPATFHHSSCSCPSAGHSSLVQTVSDPISSCAQQLEIPILCTLLPNFPLSLQAAFLQLPASCPFPSCSLWLHFFAMNLLHLFAVISNTILPVTRSSSHLPSSGYGNGLVILGWDSHFGVPLPWPCLLCSWQTTKSRPSLH